MVKDELSGLFKMIDNTHVNQDIFNFVNSELLDKFYVAMYGNRQVTALVKTNTLEDVSKVVADRYLKKWNNVVTSYLDSINLTKDYKEVITETVDNTGLTQSNRTNVNKVSAYNTDDFINNDEDTTEENINIEGTTTKESTRTRIKDSYFYDGVMTYLTAFDIYDIMVTDINSMLTINIF